MKSILALSAAALAAASPLELEATPTTTTTAAGGQCTQPEGAPGFVQPGTVCPCYEWDAPGRGEDCAAVAQRHGVPEETIIKWNPWVSDPDLPQYPCIRAGWGNNLCVNITYHPPPPPPCQTNPPKGYRDDTVCHCKKWHTSDHQDTCEVVEKNFDITRDQLVEMNPWLELKYDNGTVIADCTIIFVNEVMCVGL